MNDRIKELEEDRRILIESRNGLIEELEGLYARIAGLQPDSFTLRLREQSKIVLSDERIEEAFKLFDVVMPNNISARQYIESVLVLRVLNTSTVVRSDVFFACIHLGLIEEFGGGVLSPKGKSYLRRAMAYSPDFT